MMEKGNLPAWIESLREDLALNEALELQWLTPEESTLLTASWLENWAQIPYDESFHHSCQERLERSVPLALGLTRERRLSHTRSQLVLVYDPDHPETPWINLCYAMPSALWVKGSPDIVEFRDALATYLTDPSTDSALLPRVVRIAKPLEVEDPNVIAQAIDNLEFWIDDTTWGSAHDSDPWIRIQTQLNTISQMIATQQCNEQDPGRFPLLGYRSLWSRSAIHIEQHPFDMFVFEIHYIPAEDSEAIENINREFEMSLPLDLPLDVAASMLRGPCLTLEDAIAQEQNQPDSIGSLMLRMAIEPTELTSIAAFRKAIERNQHDEDVLGFLAGVASNYQHDALMFDILALASEHLRADLVQFLAPPQENPEEAELH